MRVLVTGGAGYIGSGVVEQLVESGHSAIVYDSLYKGHRDAVHPEAEFIHADLLDAKALGSALDRVEAVVHMAADALVGESVSEPAKYYRNNLVAGLALLEAMKQRSVRWLVFSSTAAVYGEPARQPIEESALTVPTNPYGETKLAFERALHWYSLAYGLRSISLRYFNAAGATERLGEDHDPESHLIPIVLQVPLGKREHVQLFGTDYPTPDGTCIRDYIHVADLAEAHLLALRAIAAGGGHQWRGGRAYNLGNGTGYSNREVLEAARRVTGHPIPVVEGPRRPGDPAALVASSDQIRRDLGWQPHYPGIDEIVASAWRWHARFPDGYGR
jgi:UDP-glucose 4-epimerase